MKIIHEFDQHSLDWYKIRCGRLTASQLSGILTPAKLQLSTQSDALARTIAAERIKGKSEATAETSDMVRGQELESEARIIYHEKFNAVYEVGFIENNDYGFQFGASPDGLLSKLNGGIEIKCPCAKGHMWNLLNRKVDGEHNLQMQGTMLAGDLDFIDYVSFHEGLKMSPIRIYRDSTVINAIIEAGKAFEEKVQAVLEQYKQCSGLNTEMAREI
jgi:hypothetical protein